MVFLYYSTECGWTQCWEREGSVRDNHLCSPARRAGEHEKLSGTDTPSGSKLDLRAGRSFHDLARGLSSPRNPIDLFPLLRYHYI